MNITILGLIVGWITVNVVILINSDRLFESSIEYQTGHIIGFLIPTVAGAFVINYIGNKIINRKKSKIESKID